VARRIVALTLWAFGTWVLLTWTLTWSQLLFGAGLSLLVALACAALGDVARPWALLHPRRLFTSIRLLLRAVGRVVRANLSLAKRIWSPSRPLRSGMVIVPTLQDSEAGLTAVGLITSVIVDNQIVDLDLERSELQYHGVWIDTGDPEENFESMNGPVERLVKVIVDS
jgi:multicomponent Na+:H+ antiporter subunit E